MADGPASTVVLVHGAWHGGWCWSRVVEGLSARQVATTAPDLPGHGGDTGPFEDLHGDAARVRQVLDRLEPPVVLVGHSYGGAVITEAGDHPAVSRLVFLCALALDETETCTTAVTGPPAASISYEGRPDVGAGTVVSEDGLISLRPELAAAALYNRCDADTTAWAVARLGPQPMVTLEQTPERVSWKLKPSTYLVCGDDQIIHPDLQRVMAERCGGGRVEWDSDHSPFLSCPERVVDLLTELAR